jgi:hypothetical protein
MYAKSTVDLSCSSEIRHQIVDVFIYEIGRDEKDLEKCAKIDNLKLRSDEWESVALFNSLLAVRQE